MTRNGVATWTAREVAEANRFARDFLGPRRGRSGRSGKSWRRSRPPAEFDSGAEAFAPPADLFHEINHARPHVPPDLPSRVQRSRGAATPVGLPPAIAPSEAAPAPAPPFPTNCTTLSVFRRVLLETEEATAVTAATATTPPVKAIATTVVPRIADFDAQLPRQAQRVGATEFLVTNTGRALIDTGHFRVDPADATRFQVRVKGQLCHPARVGDRTKLPEGSDRCPVVVIIHGQHAAIEFTLADSGGPRGIGASGSGPATLIPARAGVAFEVPNHLGYTNLQEHLARQGIVSVSIDTNAANELDSLMAFRGELGLAMLDHLRELDRDATSPLHGRLDFTRVGVVGHSRGGDAVAILAARNARRPVARRFGIRSVVQIAPTDFTGMTRTPLRMNKSITDSFLVVYGSHDGDVSGAFGAADRSQGWGFVGTGFRHYDRSGTQRAMVFIHGATHNRFNSVWIDPARHRPGSGARALAGKQADNSVDAATVDPALPAAATDPPASGQRDRRVLSGAAHRTLMREYIGGWLFKQLQGNAAATALFNGTAVNSLGTPVSLQWKHGPAVRTVDFFDDLDPRRSDIGGTSTTPPFVGEQLIELSQPANIPHHDRVLRAQAPSGALLVYTTRIPAGKRDLGSFSHLTCRISKVFPDLTTPAAIGGTSFPASIEVALFDGSNRRAVNAAALAALNPRALRPYHRIRGSENLTKVELQTFAVPLAQYSTGSGAVSLSSVQAIEITFNASTGQEIHLDTLSFVRI
ncbi:MAG: hypothetical protein ABJC89_17445 [Acidobacteriota bacterium]